MDIYCGEGYLHAFLSLVPDGDELSASSSSQLYRWYACDRKLSGPQSQTACNVDTFQHFQGCWESHTTWEQVQVELI